MGISERVCKNVYVCVCERERKNVCEWMTMIVSMNVSTCVNESLQIYKIVSVRKYDYVFDGLCFSIRQYIYI